MTVGESNRLPILAGEIKTALAAVHRHHAATVISAIDAGERLREAKALLSHGQWTLWLKEHCNLSGRTARDYCRLAEHRDQIGSAATIRAALAAIANEADPCGGMTELEAMDAMRAAAREMLSEIEAWLPVADTQEILHIIRTCDQIIEGEVQIVAIAQRRLGELSMGSSLTTIAAA